MYEMRKLEDGWEGTSRMDYVKLSKRRFELKLGKWDYVAHMPHLAFE